MRSAVLLALLLLPAVAAGAVAPAAAPGEGAENADVVASCVLDLGLVCTFDPPVLKVPPGTTVTWTIASQCHTVTAGVAPETEVAEGAVPPGLNLNSFNSGNVCPGGTYARTFAAGGVYKYYCAVGFHHALGMQGVVVVA